MAVTAKMYNLAFTALANKEIDWGSDTIKVALCTSSYTPSQSTHNYYDDITNEVSNGNGYTTGGATLANKTEAFVGQVKQFKADDTSWSNSTITARYAIIYDDTPATAGTKPLIGYVDFGADVTSTAGAFTIEWHDDGLFTITVS